ncbi:MAG: hypothetical protein HY327_08375 [Chloroflexi bacterium]|nr:hypothetical protein [Chloroflexota bacterium]
MDNSDTLGILKQLEQGEITAQQADEKLNAPPVEREYTPRVEKTDAPGWVQRFWLYPLAAGLLTVGIGAWIIAGTVSTNVWWLLLGVPVVLMGAFILAFAAWIRYGHWVHINIQTTGRRRNQTIRVSVPFPIGLLRFALQIARRFKPRIRAKVNLQSSRVKFDAVWDNAEEFLNAIERELAEQRGISVDVNDRGEKVQVHIV